MRCFAAMFLPLFLAQSAQAASVADAQAFVKEQLEKKVDVLDAANCKEISKKNGKLICAIKKDGEEMSPVLVVSLSKRKLDTVKQEHTTIKQLREKEFPAAEVGSEFLDELPCVDEKDRKRECGGFVEERLEGAEIQWAQYNADIVGSRNCDRNNEGFKKKIKQLYDQSGPVRLDGKDVSMGKLLSVKGGEEGFRGKFATKVAKIAESVIKHRKMVSDMQTFVPDSGDAKIFDAEAFTEKEKDVKCWGEALLAFSDLIKPPRE